MGRRKLEPVPQEFQQAPAPIINSARDLMARELPPISWVVPGILPEGVTLLAGKAKVRKSWLAMGMCVAVASGGYALGKMRVERGESLYAALEDNERRLQSRLGKVLHGAALREAPEGFYYTTAWPRLNEGGIQALDAWLSEHPQCRLVVLDTLAKVKPRLRGSSGGYQEDYEALEHLLPLASEHQVAIMVVTHTRKAGATEALDEINATMGLMGGVDGFLIFRTRNGKNEVSMHVDGREIEEPGEYALSWDQHAHGWVLVGDAEDTQLTEQRRAILDALKSADEPIGPTEIARATDISNGSVRNLLGVLVVDGRIERTGRGRYRIAEYGRPENVTLSLDDDNGDDIHKPDRYGKNPSNVTDVSNVTGYEPTNVNTVTDDTNDIDDKQGVSPIDKGKTNVIGNVIGEDDDDKEGGAEHPWHCDCGECL